MKKFFSLLAISISILAGFSACEEEDATYTPTESSIKLIQTDVHFDCLGGEGSIVFESENKVSFSCDSAWVELSQPTEGTILVKVGKNYNNIQGRNAVIKLSDGQGEKDIVVIQNGVNRDFTPTFTVKDAPTVAIVGNEEEYSALWLPSNEAATYAFGYSSVEPLLLSEEHEKWYGYELTEDSLYITVEPNTSGHLRQGFLVFECGALRDVLIISQYDLNEDIYGPAKLAYYDYDKKNKATFKDTLDVNVTKDGFEIVGSENYSKEKKPWVIPMKHNGTTLNFTLSNMSYVGDYSGKYDLDIVGIGAGLAPDFANVSYTDIPFYDWEDNATYLSVALDPESLYGFGLGVFTMGAAATEANYKKTIYQYILGATLIISREGNGDPTASSYRNIDVPTLRAKRPKKK